MSIQVPFFLFPTPRLSVRGKSLTRLCGTQIEVQIVTLESAVDLGSDLR